MLAMWVAYWLALAGVVLLRALWSGAPGYFHSAGKELTLGLSLSVGRSLFWVTVPPLLIAAVWALQRRRM